MIIINYANINNGGLSMNINIETNEGYLITSGKLWTEDSFKNEIEAKDLDFKLEQIDNKEIFILNASEIGLSNFNGIYFLEFKTNEPEPEEECVNCTNPTLITISNLNKYYKCMSELILKSDLCNNNLFSKEVCDDSGANKAITVSLLIETIDKCLELGQLVEAIDLVKTLKKLCSGCTNCNKIENTSSCNTCNTYVY